MENTDVSRSKPHICWEKPAPMCCRCDAKPLQKRVKKFVVFRRAVSISAKVAIAEGAGVSYCVVGNCHNISIATKSSSIYYIRQHHNLPRYQTRQHSYLILMPVNIFLRVMDSSAISTPSCFAISLLKLVWDTLPMLAASAKAIYSSNISWR